MDRTRRTTGLVCPGEVSKKCHVGRNRRPHALAHLWLIDHDFASRDAQEFRRGDAGLQPDLIHVVRSTLCVARNMLFVACCTLRVVGVW